MSFVGLLLVGKRAKDMVVALFRSMGWRKGEKMKRGKGEKMKG